MKLVIKLNETYTSIVQIIEMNYAFAQIVIDVNKFTIIITSKDKL